jgi:hypothetical protein
VSTPVSMQSRVHNPVRNTITDAVGANAYSDAWSYVYLSVSFAVESGAVFFAHRAVRDEVEA